eukprot:scaffold10199_cov146-Cylindrotheca_fusiformis.AAC.23
MGSRYPTTHFKFKKSIRVAISQNVVPPKLIGTVTKDSLIKKLVFSAFFTVDLFFLLCFFIGPFLLGCSSVLETPIQARLKFKMEEIGNEGLNALVN